MSQRQLREIAQRQRCAAHTIVLVGAKVELAEELETLALRVPLALPDLKELAGILPGEALAWQNDQGRRIEVDNDVARAREQPGRPVAARRAAHRAQAYLQ